MKTKMFRNFGTANRKQLCFKTKQLGRKSKQFYLKFCVVHQETKRLALWHNAVHSVVEMTQINRPERKKTVPNSQRQHA